MEPCRRHEQESYDDLLETYGMTSLLFETPTGFAVFNFYAMNFFVPNAIEVIWVNFAEHFLAKKVVWLNEFQTFDDKSSAINVDTGVDEKLTKMIMNHHRPKKKLLVAKPEYKSIIEKCLGINCLHNELVMEVMWGIKHLMHKLVIQEKSQLSMEDRLPMSQGLQIYLRRYGFIVEPEMINEEIVATARFLFRCDDVEQEEYEDLCAISHFLKEVSGFDYESWDALKLATAFKIISTREVGDSEKMFPEDVISKLLSDADKYDDKIDKVACLRTYSQVASAHKLRFWKRKKLDRLVKRAKKVYQAERVEVSRKLEVSRKRKAGSV